MNEKNKEKHISQIPEGAVELLKEILDFYKDILSTTPKEAFVSDNFKYFKALNKITMQFPKAYDVYKNLPQDAPDELKKNFYQKIYKESFENPAAFDDITAIRLYKKCGFHPDPHIFTRIIKKELDSNNLYPNFEVVNEAIDMLIDKDGYFNDHAAYHLFDKGYSLLEREETYPMAVKIFEKTAKEYDDFAINSDIIFEEYLNYKEIMAHKGISIEESDAFKRPDVAELLAKQQNIRGAYEFQKKLKNDPNTLYIKAHLVDIDGTLIQDEKLNETLYNEMLKAKTNNEPIYLFSGENKMLQLPRLHTVGVDTNRFPLIDKYEFKNTIILGSIIDDVAPHRQSFSIENLHDYQTPDENHYFFQMENSNVSITVDKLLSIRRKERNATNNKTSILKLKLKQGNNTSL